MCIRDRHGDVQRLKDLLVDDVLHQRQLLGSHRAEMGEVEAHPLVVLIGTGLMHMAAQHLAQRLLQQMGAGVVAGDGAPAALGHADVYKRQSIASRM